jgi:hypothetical protein
VHVNSNLHAHARANVHVHVSLLVFLNRLYLCEVDIY